MISVCEKNTNTNILNFLNYKPSPPTNHYTVSTWVHTWPKHKHVVKHDVSKLWNSCKKWCRNTIISHFTMCWGKHIIYSLKINTYVFSSRPPIISLLNTLIYQLYSYGLLTVEFVLHAFLNLNFWDPLELYGLTEINYFSKNLSLRSTEDRKSSMRVCVWWFLGGVIASSSSSHNSPYDTAQPLSAPESLSLSPGFAASVSPLSVSVGQRNEIQWNVKSDVILCCSAKVHSRLPTMDIYCNS